VLRQHATLARRLPASRPRTRQLRLICVLAGVMVVTVNLATMLAVRGLSWTDRWTTRTSMERWVTLKLSISQLTNAFAAPVLAAYLSGNRASWYSRGGLAESAFFVQCANGLMVPLFHLLGPGDNLKWFLLSPFARTQVISWRRGGHPGVGPVSGGQILCMGSWASPAALRLAPPLAPRLR
jgi:hypothetical protein